MTEFADLSYYSDGVETRQEGDAHYVSGIVVPYGRMSHTILGNIAEVWERGAAVIKEKRIPLLKQHNLNDFPIGRLSKYRQTDDGLWAEFKLGPSDDAKTAFGEVRSGNVDGLSVGFGAAEREDRRKGKTRISLVKRAEIRHVGLVGFPAFGQARVTGFRSADGLISMEELEQEGPLDEMSELVERLEKVSKV